ncbi:hypothetical protein [Candidatus Solincola sp.]|nr:hypothetical protein [Actinomycetota bacterium]MDI7251256.1 hypothetical protein [Actinomycetota bacterium]
MARIPVIVEEENSRKGFRGLLKRLLPLGIAAALVLQFARLDESRKRFILHLVKQVPYLPGRYFA